MSDKTWSALFDNAKVKSVAGLFEASENIDWILRESIVHAKQRLKAPAPAENQEDRLIDRIIAAQAALRP